MKMAVQLVTIKCPECGATLNFEDNRELGFCSYCGAKVLIHNENEYVYRRIDEAGIKQAETDRLVKMRQMELAEKKRAAAEKTKALKIKVALIMAALGGILMVTGFVAGHASGDPDSGLYSLAFVGLFSLMGAGFVGLSMIDNNKEDEADPEDKVKVPSSISDYEKKSYSAIEAILVGAGFTNVKCVALNDLKVGFLKKPGMVESISINGKEVTSGGKKFSKDAAVVISYHSLNH